MTDIEDRLRVAMHAAVDDTVPPPGIAGAVIRRHRRHVGMVAGLTVLAVALAAVPAAVALTGERAVAPGHSQSRSPSPLRHLPARFSGLPMSAAQMPLPLPLSGGRPSWLIAGTGPRRSEPIAGLPFAKNGYNLVRVAGGWAAEPFPGAPACCAGRRVPIYFVADGARAATRIGTGYAAIAAAQAGVVWLTTYQGRRTRIGTASATVREATVSGKAFGPAVHLPGGYYIVRAVGPYLLLAKVDQGRLPVVDELWDPVTGRVVRDFTGVIGASATQIAWQPALYCRNCVLHLVNLVTFRSETVRLPVNTRAFSGTFSADRRLLAIGMSTSATPDGEVVLGRLGVIDTTSARLTVVPGSSVRAVTEQATEFGWLGDSHRLVAVLGLAGGPAQLATWWPGDPDMRVARLVPPPGRWPVVGENG